MNQADLDHLRADARAIFTALYLLDVETLSKPQLELHQQQLAAAHAALVKLENAHIQNLSETALKHWPVLQASLVDLKAKAEQGGKPASIMAALGDGLDKLGAAVKAVFG